MHADQLIHILAGIPPKDIKQLKSFINALNNKSNSNKTKLFEALIKFHPDFDTKKVKREEIFTKVFPGLNFNYNKLANVSRGLKKVIQQFIAVQGMEQEEYATIWFQMQYFKNQNATAQYISTIKQLKKIKRDPLKMKMSDHLYRWRIANDIFFNEHTKKVIPKSNSLTELTFHFDNLFILGKLRQASELLARSKFLNTGNEKLFFLNEVLNHIDNNVHYQDHLLIRFYYHLTKLQLQKDHERFLLLKKDFKNHLAQLSRKDAGFILMNLINYSYYVYNNNQGSYINHIFDLYEFGLEGKLIPNERIMTPSTFLNIVMVCALTKQFEYARQFIFQFRSKVDSNSRKYVTKLSQAILFFHNQQYDKVVEELINFDTTNVLHTFQLKNLLLRSFYVIFVNKPREYRLFLSYSLSFEAYVKQNRIVSSNRKASYLNQIKLLRKMARYRLLGEVNANKIKGWQKTARSERNMNSREWLLSELELMYKGIDPRANDAPGPTRQEGTV